MSEPKRYAPAYVYSNPYSDEHAPGMEEDGGGDYVSYDDYAALRSQLAAALQVNSAALDKAESERDEARRELAVLRDTVLVERQAIEQLRHRAERAEAVVDKARRLMDGGPRYEEALYDAVDAFDAAEGSNA